MALRFRLLADYLDAIPIISKWYFDEWGHLTQGDTIEATRDRVERYANRSEIPFIIVATNNSDVVAVAQLKYREMAEMFPDKAHWLGGVYVPANHRCRAYGQQIVERIIKVAPTYGVETLYLQTEALDGGLYASLGWVPYAQVINRGLDVLVMERQIFD